MNKPCSQLIFLIKPKEDCEEAHPKTDIVVPVVWIVPVTVRATRPVLIVVERAAPQNTVAFYWIEPHN
jgi:hypothetical protein